MIFFHIFQGDDTNGKNDRNIESSIIQNNDEDGDFERPLKKVKIDNNNGNSNNNNNNDNSDNDENKKNNNNNNNDNKDDITNYDNGHKITNKKVTDISTDIVVRNVFNSELLRVSFTKDMWGRLLVPTDTVCNGRLNDIRNDDNSRITLEEKQAYGVQYNYCLNDDFGANKAAVDAPEWLVPQVDIYVCTFIYIYVCHMNSKVCVIRILHSHVYQYTIILYMYTNLRIYT
jgi:hypothetical protein